MIRFSVIHFCVRQNFFGLLSPPRFLAHPVLEKPHAHCMFTAAFLFCAVIHFCVRLTADFNWAAFLISLPPCAYGIVWIGLFNKLGWSVNDGEGWRK